MSEQDGLNSPQHYCLHDDGEGEDNLRRKQGMERSSPKRRVKASSAEDSGHYEITAQSSVASSVWSPRNRRLSQHSEDAPSLHHLQLNQLQHLRIHRQYPHVGSSNPPSPTFDGSYNTSTRTSSKTGSPTFCPTTNPNRFYHPPYLHPTYQQSVKETHLLDIDFDPISGRKSINRYEIIDEIGRGTHGKVKLGRDLVSGEFVAIKIVERHSRPRLGKARQDNEKVRREIAILKKCMHPNVVKLIEVIDDPSSMKVYLVLEYVELGEIMWRKVGRRDVVRREKLRLRRELAEFSKDPLALKAALEEEEKQLKRWKRRRRKQGKAWRAAAAKTGASEGNFNFWSVELGGVSEDDDEFDDDDVSGDEALTSFSSPQTVDAHLPPLDSDSEDRPPPFSNLNLVVNSPLSPPYTFSSEDLRYVPALTLDQARNVIRDTVLGLEYLHYHGIIHRDIKPANLLWTKDHRVKISDFGVSYLGRGVENEEDADNPSKDKISGQDEAVELAKTVGTPAFFAPELCFSDTSKPRPQISSAIDVWALGVTLYCLIFARCPFLADGEFELFNVIAKQELFIPKQRLRPSVGHNASSASSMKSRPTTSFSIYRRGHDRSLSAVSAPLDTGPILGRDAKAMLDNGDTEPIPDDLRDLLARLLAKDPTERITLREVKRHPWVIYGIPNPTQWFEDTDPERIGGGCRIEVNEEEMEKAVVPANWGTAVLGRMKSGIDKLKRRMGMGGGGNASSTGVSETVSAKRDMAGLHPLATFGHTAENTQPEPSSPSPSATGVNITDSLDQPSEVNTFSLPNPSTLKNSPIKLPKAIVPRLLPSSKTPPSSAGSSNLRVAVNASSASINSTNSSSHTNNNATTGANNNSRTSLAHSLSRTISGASHNSANPDTPTQQSSLTRRQRSPTSPQSTEKKEKAFRYSLRRKRSFLFPFSGTHTSSGHTKARNKSPVPSNLSATSSQASKAVSKVLRRAISSEVSSDTNSAVSPSSASVASYSSTIRRFPTAGSAHTYSSGASERLSIHSAAVKQVSTSPAANTAGSFTFNSSVDTCSGDRSCPALGRDNGARSPDSPNNKDSGLKDKEKEGSVWEIWGKGLGRRLVGGLNRSKDALRQSKMTTDREAGGDKSGKARRRSSTVGSYPGRVNVNIQDSCATASLNVATISACTTCGRNSEVASGDSSENATLQSQPFRNKLSTTSSRFAPQSVLSSPTSPTEDYSTERNLKRPNDFAEEEANNSDQVKHKEWLGFPRQSSCPPSPDDYIGWGKMGYFQRRGPSTGRDRLANENVDQWRRGSIGGLLATEAVSIIPDNTRPQAAYSQQETSHITAISEGTPSVDLLPHDLNEQYKHHGEQSSLGQFVSPSSAQHTLFIPRQSFPPMVTHQSSPRLPPYQMDTATQANLQTWNQIIFSKSEERMSNDNRGCNTGTTTSSSLTESTSFPSIQSIVDLSAASSVSVDGSLAKATKEEGVVAGMIAPYAGNIHAAVGGSSTTASSGLSSPAAGSLLSMPSHIREVRDSGVAYDDSIANLGKTGITLSGFNLRGPSRPDSVQIHSLPPTPALSPTAPSTAAKFSGQDSDDGDDEALYLDLGSNRRSRNMRDTWSSTERSVSIAVGTLDMVHGRDGYPHNGIGRHHSARHRRQTSSKGSLRERDKDKSDREKPGDDRPDKERTSRRRPSKHGKRSRSNTASSAISGTSGIVTDGLIPSRGTTPPVSSPLKRERVRDGRNVKEDQGKTEEEGLGATVGDDRKTAVLPEVEGGHFEIQ